MISQNKSIIISCLRYGAAATAVIGSIFCLWLLCVEPEDTAENYDQLELYIKFPSGVKKISIWKDETEEYYFFLPSGASACETAFGNLGKDSSIQLDGKTFGNQDDLREFLNSVSDGQACEMTMKTGEQKQDPIKIKFLQSENTATMFIDLNADSLEAIHADKEAKKTGFMQLIDCGGNSCYQGTLKYIKTRGNSTWSYDKKPYQIKLNKAAELLDMPIAEKWILLANVVDDTLIRNELVYQYAEKYTDVPAVMGKFIDLYINGEYRGNYYLCEKVEINESRLDISNLEEATKRLNAEEGSGKTSLYVSQDGKIKATQGLNNPEDITGGYLVEYIPIGEYEIAENAFQTNSGACYSIISPALATVEQAEYICGMFNEMESAMMQKDGINPVTGKHFSEYLDIESWAEKYVMEEVFCDPDAAVASMYMYKDSDSINPLIHSGPMWDYDRALGSYGIRNYGIDNADQVRGCGIYVNYLMNFEEVSQLVYEKFEEMIPYIENTARADIFELNQQISASAQMNAIRWKQSFGYYTDREANLEYLWYFLEKKKDYLKDVWLNQKEDYCTVTFLDYSGNVYKTYRVKKGDYLSEVPVISSYVAVFAGWYVKGEDIPCIPDLPILSDVIYESRWIGIDIILQNGLNMLEIDSSQIDPETLENMADMLRRMQEEQD